MVIITRTTPSWNGKPPAQLHINILLYCKACIFRVHVLFAFCRVKLFATWIFREWANITYSVKKKEHFIDGRNIGYSAII